MHAELISAIRRATQRMHRASFATKFDPNQPRIPPGNEDGGQWTDGGGGSASTPRSRPRPTAAASSGAPASSWKLQTREKIVGGERTLHLGPNGARIASERRVGTHTGTSTSRHSVLLPDGSGLKVENDRFGVQRIFDRSGNLLSTARWGRNGPEEIGTAQPAYFDDRPRRLPKGALWLELGLTVYDALKERVENSRPVVSAFIRQYRTEGDGLLPLYIGEIDQREADSACRRYPEVRTKLTELFARNLASFQGRPAALGSKVHWEMEQYVEGLGEKEFRAEVTNGVGEPAKRRDAGTTFLDIYEKMSEDTACVYDHKTGNSRLRAGRAKQLADTAAKLMGPLVRHIIVIEVRPDL